MFVLVHSVPWMVEPNDGLRSSSLVRAMLIPAAFPSILTGPEVGRAAAWRTLIAAALVFGVSSGSGGRGWYIFQNRNALETTDVFAGPFTVIVIGLFVESVIVANIERKTIRRWGMQHGETDDPAPGRATLGGYA